MRKPLGKWKLRVPFFTTSGKISPLGRHNDVEGGVSPSENSQCKQWEVLTYNFHLPSIFPHPAIIFNIQPQFLLVSKPKNCELKQKQNSCVWIPAFLRYAVNEIPISFPYRDMGMIWESYRNVIEIILGFLWEGYLFRCFVFTHNFSDLLTSCRLVVSEKRMWCVVTLKACENCKSKPPTD